ncbi:tail fiber assembly protein [Pseudomonas syringae]|uniref:Tail fiber assembly domain-containing protein n=3 Tax=Pseudomonas syringae TaxID=317 RepID=A0A656JIE4_PSESF|nr:tail fiber assembly protein [Pseudomonas syringae]EPN26821.1 tail fiber assembly domain-containing protein [Pseudomonas syringae pv. actinidiae ICMP 19096]EPM43809.1 tail fiber assembly domain-containing protein [Pseudomonas syringae pv. actinidiae ICMP 19103]EPM44369.1 tail fiber assembly domain-containing protein [Pseudomonas syringae pv. actinidiae ICMP 19098]EPN21337.1 tail fiber assembly domain-containing protein [Pseudomonas syringae pv. actinidiae ICMP 19100]EPN22770.1 tail fiber ass
MSNIDWSQLITREMKDAATAARILADAKAVLNSRNTAAALQIARIQDRIETLGYGIEAGEATEQEEAEAAALAPVLKAWKAYKFALGKVTAQPTWYQAPVWPAAPATPEIAAAPMMLDEPAA